MKWIGKLDLKNWYGASMWPLVLWVLLIVLCMLLATSSCSFPSFVSEYQMSAWFLFAGATLFQFFYYHMKYQQYEKRWNRHQELIEEHRILNWMEW